MRDVILEKLKEIEEKENVEILFAIESGSRAWGFASPNSDYDVRFVYKRKVEDYLNLKEVRDVIEWQLDETLDINGWDLKKALQLLYSSNPTIFEWIDSPIIYKQTEEFEIFKELAKEYFSKKKSLYHYLHTTNRTYNDHLNNKEEVKFKKYFYAIRPLFAAKWILEKNEPAPMLFETLVEEMASNEIKVILAELLKKKKSALEQETIKSIKELNDYITSNLAEITKTMAYIEDSKNNYDKLNQFFVKSILKK